MAVVDGISHGGENLTDLDRFKASRRDTNGKMSAFRDRLRFAGRALKLSTVSATISAAKRGGGRRGFSRTDIG